MFDKKPNESKKASKSGIFSRKIRIKNKAIELMNTTRRMVKRERLVKIKPRTRKTDTRPMIWVTMRHLLSVTWSVCMIFSLVELFLNKFPSNLCHLRRIMGKSGTLYKRKRMNEGRSWGDEKRITYVHYTKFYFSRTARLDDHLCCVDLSAGRVKFHRLLFHRVADCSGRLSNSTLFIQFTGEELNSVSEADSNLV